jgi:phage anti-repressor protein
MISHLLSNETKQLYKQPFKQKLFGKNHLPESGYHHQIDILYLPNDDGFKYLLTVIDLYDSRCDAIALKRMEMENLIHALQHLYDNSMNLIQPKLLQADQQFNNKRFKDWCEENDINYKFSDSNDHLAMSHIERLNKTLGTWIHQLQVEKEAETGEVNTSWKKDYPKLIEIINNKNKTKKRKPFDDRIKLNNTNNSLIAPNTEVRLAIQKDEPQSYFGQRMKGTLRAGDIKWSPELYEVVSVIMIPGNPPLFKLRKPNGKIMGRLVSRERLQVV